MMYVYQSALQGTRLHIETISALDWIPLHSTSCLIKYQDILVIEPPTSLSYSMGLIRASILCMIIMILYLLKAEVFIIMDSHILFSTRMVYPELQCSLVHFPPGRYGYELRTQNQALYSILKVITPLGYMLIELQRLLFQVTVSLFRRILSTMMMTS